MNHDPAEPFILEPDHRGVQDDLSNYDPYHALCHRLHRDDARRDHQICAVCRTVSIVFAGLDDTELDELLRHRRHARGDR